MMNKNKTTQEAFEDLKWELRTLFWQLAYVFRIPHLLEWLNEKLERK